jgi:DNA ligase D-like protein (predicted 3'-phosphoesterase)
MSLKEYQSKRDFEKTEEPAGSVRPTPPTIFAYVIQRHQATHLHYDLRLEMNGVLRSWALPKGPPLQPNVKRLAVQVEDHPLEYGSFEGTIPEGEYGAGKVEVWDRGTYTPIEVDENKVIVTIEGRKLQGDYCLIKLRPKTDSKNWLFFKKRRQSKTD